MTTTVTVTTHAWPVEVTITDDYDLSTDRHVYHAETSIVPPDSKQDFYLTSTRSISYREMPIPHVEGMAAAG